jgi:hypothetical protein
MRIDKHKDVFVLTMDEGEDRSQSSGSAAPCRPPQGVGHTEFVTFLYQGI